MNDKENIVKVNKRIKKYAVSLGSVMLIFAVMAVVSVTNDSVVTQETTTSSSEKEVEVKIDNEPDTRTSETIIVPATVITTQAVIVTEESTQDEQVNAAPDSYILPMGTDIGSDYSCGVPVYNSVMSDWRTHDGVDFNGDYGDGVKSIADGIVKGVTTDELMGSVITVDHGGGVVADYCGVVPADGIIKGVIVSQGQKLGEIGEIPCEADAEFPHLHLEIIVDGEYADPLEIMGYYE